MGLLKKGYIISLTLLCSSCAQHQQTAMSSKDQDLLNLTLKNSTRAFNSDLTFSDLEAHLQMPKNLQHALSFYQEQYKHLGTHDYESLQKIGFKILQEAIFQDDVEAQLLSLYGVDLAKHPKLMPILEQALESPFNLVQMTAIQALSKLPDDRANALLVKGCSSPFLDVAFMTAYILAERHHPEAFGLIESLINKAPPECAEFFPTLLALIDNQQALTKLRKLLNHPQDRVRIAAINAAGSLKKAELLPDIRSLALQHNILIQEACAYALGELHDESSIALLQEIALSPSESTRLAALDALRKLGYTSAIEQIEIEAQKGSLFAIELLKDCPCDISLLSALAKQTQNKNIALNASLVLLHKKDPKVFENILPLLDKSDPNLGMAFSSSPAMTMHCIKFVFKGSLRSQESAAIEQMSLSIRQKILAECAELPETAFLKIAQHLVDSNQNDLIPYLIDQMIVLKTTKVKDLLKDWQQKVGSPYVRAWSNLALLKLNEAGPWKDNVLAWIKKRKYHRLVRMKDFAQLQRKKWIDPFEINPLETSQLLLESYLAIAQKQDEEGIGILLDSLANNDLKNKYAIAGLLILSTQ